MSRKEINAERLMKACGTLGSLESQRLVPVGSAVQPLISCLHDSFVEAMRTVSETPRLYFELYELLETMHLYKNDATNAIRNLWTLETVQTIRNYASVLRTVDIVIEIMYLH
jgi:hypothetical protein